LILFNEKLFKYVSCDVCMAISQNRSRRKVSGGLYKNIRKKRLSDLGRDPTMTKVGKRKLRMVRVRSARIKRALLFENTVNLVDSKTKRTMKVKIKSVLENPANRHFVRRNILTKGTIIDTDVGKARITSRPGQHGVLNAVLLN